MHGKARKDLHGDLQIRVLEIQRKGVGCLKRSGGEWGGVIGYDLGLGEEWMDGVC